MPARAFVELLDRDAVRVQHLHGRLGDVLRDLHHMREFGGIDVEQVARGSFRQHQRMSGRARHDVEKSKRLVVLVDLVTGQFAAEDLCEDVVRIVARHAVWSFYEVSSNTKSFRNGPIAASSEPAAVT